MSAFENQRSNQAFAGRRRDGSERAGQQRLFEEIAELVRRETGIALTAARKAQLFAKIRRRCHALGFQDVTNYAQLLLSGQRGPAELETLVSLATTNVTEFFRHREQFDVFENVVMPELLAARRDRRLLRIWSAGCATGEEVYSIAMIVLEKLGVGSGWDVKVLGTDLSRRALTVAERGVYTTKELQNVPGALIKRYFRRSTQEGTMEVTDRLRGVTLFRRLNLMNRTYPLRKDVDVIFFRNVAIYFEPDIRRAVLFRIADHLRPGGFLVLGPAENLMDMRERFVPVRANVFRKCFPGAR